MKIWHKIAKLTQPLTYRRTWRRAQRFIFRLPLGPLRTDIDQERLREIQQRYAASTAKYAKYANVDPWLRLNRERVQDLKLHRSAPKRVLDLGCGGGFFLFILKKLGHSVLGLDIDQAPLFAELLDVFEVPRVVWRINAFEPLPDLGQKFDWITAFSINFNLHYPGERLWGPPEWDFLLRDLQRHLAPAGKIFFGLNPSFGGNYYSPELRDFFLRRGADVERARIFFDRGVRFQLNRVVAVAVASIVLKDWMLNRRRSRIYFNIAHGVADPPFEITSLAMKTVDLPVQNILKKVKKKLARFRGVQ